jgi:hypothetical protein
VIEQRHFRLIQGFLGHRRLAARLAGGPRLFPVVGRVVGSLCGIAFC